MPELHLLRYAVVVLSSCIDRIRRDERGTTLEVVLLSVSLATAALVAGAVLVARITEQANSIPTGPVATP